MRLNTITCLGYDVAPDRATVLLASTNLDAIKALPTETELMLYDDIGHPLFSLDGYAEIVSIRIILADDTSEVVFGKKDTAIADLQRENRVLQERVATLEKAQDGLNTTLTSLRSSVKDFGTRIGTLEEIKVPVLKGDAK